jgi:galactokinase
MSSSAALECSTIFALNELFQLKLDRITMIKMAQKAENEFVGVQSGIMDQFASMLGKKNNVIKLDCRSLEYEYLPFEMGELRVVLFDTNVKHSLASSEYNTRRKQCEEGVALVKEHYPEVKSLRDVTVEMLNECVKSKDPLIYQRCLYVVEEIQRLLDAAVDLQKGDLKSFGKKMYATHDGLSKQYEVSCKELDFLVDFVRNEPAVLGARMMGGGFGGCTINLIKEEAITALAERIGAAYSNAMQLDLKTYVAEIENGTELLQLKH